jgi:hypothetical protein
MTNQDSSITTNSRSYTLWRLALMATLLATGYLLVPSARADEDKDPPSRVARIRDTDGSVSLQPGGEGEWGTAARNRPVTVGDKLWTDKDSRAELQAGQAALHLGSMTSLSFLNLDQNMTQVRLPEGHLNFRVRELRQGDLYEVDAPNLAFTVKQAGAFRVDVNENGDSSRVTVIRGEGEVTAGGKTYEIHAGESGEFNGTDNVEYSIGPAPSSDGLDRWAEQRDLKEDNSVSARYVSRDMTGYDDLDDHGTWSEEPEYGHVWYPHDVDPGWAPYSNGYWSWVSPWGWTWVDYSPWGFAPFHYGRWAYIHGGWGWCPGPIYGPPIYGPAFVGFYGGGGWGFGLGIGVGWFPLGYGEPFYPWYHCRSGYIRNINIYNTHIRNVNVFNGNIHNANYAYAHNLNAVTVANRNTFVNGQAIHRNGVHLAQSDLNRMKVNNSVGLKPTAHSSLGAANVNSHVARPPDGIQNRPVLARTAPAQAAARAPVRTISARGLASGRSGNSPVSSVSGAHNNVVPGMSNRGGGASNNPSNTARQRDLSRNRPPSAMPNYQRNAGGTSNVPATRGGASNGRAWDAQGNSTDRGRPPVGAGNSNRASNPVNRSTVTPRNDRPSWAGSGQPGTPRSAPSYNNNRPPVTNNGRTYQPPQRSSGNAPASSNGRGSSQSRSYSPPPSRSYSAPRTYSPPGRSYPAPSRSYSPPAYSGGARGNQGGGGGAPRGSSQGGGSAPRGGGGSHPSGGSSPHSGHH